MIAREPWFPAVDPELAALVRDEGLELAGVCDVHDGVEEEAQFRRWLAEGRHGTMEWMEAHAPLKYRPSVLVPGARSMLFVAINYYQRDDEVPDAPHGRVARYAWGRDYHKELGRRLKRIARELTRRYPDETFRAWTDATPVAERYYGERAGIGFTGRHTLLINGQFGSWFVIGEIVSTRHVPPSEMPQGRHGGCPTSCRKCIDVCPTGALEGPHMINASRCISYLTIEHDGTIPEELRPAMGTWIFGCDLCQEVCPLNVRARVTDVPNFLRPIAGGRPLLADILAIESDEAFTQRFAGSPLMRARRRRLVRNACIAAANANARELAPLLQRRAVDDDPVIAEHAAWALDQLH